MNATKQEPRLIVGELGEALKKNGWERYTMNQWRVGYILEATYQRFNADGTAQSVLLNVDSVRLSEAEVIEKADKSPRLRFDDYKSKSQNGYALQYSPTALK